MQAGNNIKKLRELRDFSQQSLALSLNISQKQMSRIENNEVSPTLELIISICKVLGVSIQELLDFTESNIFNSISTNQQGGEFKTNNYNNTDIKQVQDLYEKLLTEKERTIQILQNQMK